MCISNKLKELETQVSLCKRCVLHESRTQTVFSRGNELSQIIFVAEAPGQHEDLQGKPLVGRSGQLLDSTLSSMDLDPSKDIYVCNIIKCRPPGNRRPKDDEVNACIDFFESQVKLLTAKVILAMGNTAAENLVNSAFGITKIRGKVFQIKRLGKIVIPTFHPSFILRNGGYGSEIHKLFKQDIQLAIKKSKELICNQVLTD